MNGWKLMGNSHTISFSNQALTYSPNTELIILQLQFTASLRKSVRGHGHSSKHKAQISMHCKAHNLKETADFYREEVKLQYNYDGIHD